MRMVEDLANEEEEAAMFCRHHHVPPRAFAYVALSGAGPPRTAPDVSG